MTIGLATAADGGLIGRLLADKRVAYRELLPGQEEEAPDVMAQAGHAGAVTVLAAEVARAVTYHQSPRPVSRCGTLIDKVAEIYVRRYKDPDRLLSALSRLYDTHITADDLTGGDPEQRISSDAHAAYTHHEQFMRQATMRQTERNIVFSVINRNWCQLSGVIRVTPTHEPYEWRCDQGAGGGAGRCCD